MEDYIPFGGMKVLGLFLHLCFHSIRHILTYQLYYNVWEKEYNSLLIFQGCSGPRRFSDLVSL